ncbi:MAG: hypothetical protein G8237_06145 [Magnetococcales bacterium]|nr:hypothetical protein [Magnetococcales bacterium]NGZ05921.1 hypothetical protein [Magnetococcales bacterium]
MTTQNVVILARKHLRTMIRMTRLLRRLALQQAQPWPDTPDTARFDPGHEAVMMGYDFHLTPNGPRLIEVNTNAGGALMAHTAQHPDQTQPLDPLSRHPQRLLATFMQEMALFRQTPRPVINRMVILDEQPANQFLYPEMQACAALLNAVGIPCSIHDPAELRMDASGVTLHGAPVDLIYNRHCDFYLETPSLAGLRAAWLNRQLCLTPNPRAYALLADKRHLITWSDPDTLLARGVAPDAIRLLTDTIPTTRLLSTLDRTALWKERARWVFKPSQGFGGRGVLLGDKISRTRFDSLDGATLVQSLVPPPTLRMAPSGTLFKYDIRLFVYRDQILGVAARAYRGQVTNFREPGNGFLPVQISI